jgi:putative ABC transport system permease protein
MLIFKLAFRNIVGAGLRTWLNVFILSLAFLTIIWMQGFLEGFNRQAMDAMIDMELGGGQFWHRSYDRYDPLTLEDAHAPLSPSLKALVKQGRATPILITSGAVFPEGRVRTILIKGIEPDQKLVQIPADILGAGTDDIIPALIGGQMAKETRLNTGDEVTVRWRDIHGTFDAADIRIVRIMNTTVPTIDANQIWIPMASLQEMIQAPGQATLVVMEKNIKSVPQDEDQWIFRDLDYLVKDLKDFIKAKSAGSAIMYILLLFMALLAIFDTQVLAIFRRRKEMGTLMALGMPRGKIIGLFTVEGALHGLLALLAGAVYGIPLLALSATKGFSLPPMADNMGFAISDTLYPSYGAGLVVGTTLLVLITVTIVSFLPTRKISRLKPTDALRGKMS